MDGDDGQSSRDRGKTPDEAPFPLLRRGLWLFIVGAIALGTGVTAFWVLEALEHGALGYLSANLHLLGLGLVLAATLTLVNICLRWMRWHFLIRRVGASVATKDSLLIYLATLPMVLTPFYVGELVRVAMLGKTYSRYRFDVAGIWILERSSDLLALCLMLSVITGQYRYLGVAGFLWLALVLLLKWAYRHIKLSRYPKLATVLATLASSMVFCLIPAAALWSIDRVLASPLGIVPTLDVYISSTLLGTITGLPSGVGVTGSAMMTAMQGHGVTLIEAMYATLFFRMGTTWFVVLFGTVALVVSRDRLLEILRAGQVTEHFDELAGRYDDELPSWIRHRLLKRKVGAMHRRLASGPPSATQRGLDIGCGQGWHGIEMARLGYDMHGIDPASQQVQLAEEHARKQSVHIALHSASATALPFPDAHFDLVYAINVFHHLTDEDQRAKAFDEVVRVLKPEGTFFLHEMNTINPLFRIYMGYLFPLIRGIDQGTEIFIKPNDLPEIEGAHWHPTVDYFTFLPDFVPAAPMKMLQRVERRLEGSRFRQWSAHYMAALTKK